MFGATCDFDPWNSRVPVARPKRCSGGSCRATDTREHRDLSTKLVLTTWLIAKPSPFAREGTSTRFFHSGVYNLPSGAKPRQNAK